MLLVPTKSHFVLSSLYKGAGHKKNGVSFVCSNVLTVACLGGKQGYCIGYLTHQILLQRVPELIV